MNYVPFRTGAAPLALIAAIAFSGSAHAQSAPPKPAAPPAQAGDTTSDGLGDIIVTATRTGASQLQKTPLAVSAFSADQLAQTLSSNVRDLAQFVPSLNISQVTANPVITLRGIGTNNVFNGSDPDVTMQVDGIYYARPSAQANDFIDIERVEVLRGPQGTLYGRNAIGGTINVISRRPTDKLTGEAALTVGNYGAVQGQAYLSGGLVPGKVQVSLAGTYTRHDDYERNINPNGAQSGVFNANRGGLRGQVRIELADGIDATTRADYVEQNENLPGPYHLQVPFALAPLASSLVGNDRAVAINTPSTNRYHGYGVSEEINIRLADDVTLKSLTGFRWNSYRLTTDNDGTELDRIRGAFYETERQQTQEVDLNAKIGNLDAVVGAYYFHDTAFTDVSATIIVPANIKINSLVNFFTRSYAGFAQGTYHITPTLSFTGGIRYTTEKKGIDVFVTRTSLANGATLPGFPIVFKTQPEFKAWTPKFGLDWKATPNLLLYGSITKGFKSGGTNYAANSLATAAFNPETIWSYEAGFKADLLDRHLRLNMTAFHYDYSNLQIQSSISPGVVSIGNAAQAKVDGIEAELTAKLTSHFTLSGNGSLLNARYSRFTTSSVAAALAPLIAADPRYSAARGVFDATGNKLNQSPPYSGTIAAQNDFPVGTNGSIVTVRGDVYFQGRTFYDPQNSAYTDQPPYALLNAQLGYSSPDRTFQVTLFAKNLLDKQYLFAFQANGVAPAGFAGAPRTFGIRIGKKL